MKTALILLTLLSTSAHAEWSGIRAYVKHPQEAWSGSSDCAPCNRFCSDARTRNSEIRTLGGKGWPVGYREQGNAIVILRAMDGEPVPYFVPVVDGVEQVDKKVLGYKGDIDAVLKLWPGKTTTIRGTLPAVEKIEVQRTLVDEEAAVLPPVRTRIVREIVRVPSYQAVPLTPTYSVNAYTPHWTWPGDLKSHLVKHGYSLAYLNTLTMDQLEALHDRDHDSGRVTPYGVQVRPIQQTFAVASAPVYYAPMRVMPAYQTQRYSSGINIGGFRIGGYSTGVRSNCPGGVCP